MTRALALALLLLAGAARATPAPGASGALEQLADQLAERLAAARVVGPLALHVSAARPELARGLATLLAGRLAARALAPEVLEAQGPAAAEAQAREAGARTLVRLTLEVQGGRLVARGDALSTWVNFWSGAAPTRGPQPALALAVGVEADAAALALAGRPPPAAGPGTPAGPLALERVPFAALPEPPGALAAGDLDGDGRDEVAVLLDREVRVLDASGAERARAPLDGPPSAAPCREPYGTLAVVGAPPRLAAFGCRDAEGSLFTLEGEALVRAGAPLAAPLLEAGVSAAFVPGQTALAPAADGPTALAGGPFTAWSHAGERWLWVHPDGRATLASVAAVPPLALEGLGAASALVDLTGDGAPELVTTSPLPVPTPDAVRVLALGPDGSPSRGAPLWEAALPEGRALLAAPARLGPGGASAVLLGVWGADGRGQLLLLRPASP